MLVISYGEIKTINKLPVRKTYMWGSKVPRVCAGEGWVELGMCAARGLGTGDADARAGDRSYGPT